MRDWRKRKTWKRERQKKKKKMEVQEHVVVFKTSSTLPLPNNPYLITTDFH